MPMPSKDIRVLVVDDFPTMRGIMRKILRELGYVHTQVAEDGEMAWRMLLASQFDFVVTDWSMPKMSGLELLKAIRSHERMKDLPVLMVTAEAERKSILEAIKNGVNSYVLKPFDSKVMQSKMEQIFKDDVAEAAAVDSRGDPPEL